MWSSYSAVAFQFLIEDISCEYLRNSTGKHPLFISTQKNPNNWKVKKHRFYYIFNRLIRFSNSIKSVCEWITYQI